MAGLFTQDFTNIVPGQLTRPGQVLQDGDEWALHMAEFGGNVEHALYENSVLANWLPKRSLQGTSILQNFGMGRTKLTTLKPGIAPEAGGADFSKATLTVDTVVIARDVVPMLDVFQTSYDARKELADAHGEAMAEDIDQTYFIQAARAALQPNSTFAVNGVNPEGHLGGTTVTLDAAGDEHDPSAVYEAISTLETAMVKKRVDITKGGFIIALTPDLYKSLRDAEQIVNGQYKTADGTTHEGMIFKAYGCPVVRSNNIPTEDIVGHKLSNARNGNSYDGNFSKLGGLIMSPKSLLAAETIPLQSKMWFDDTFKHWTMDSWTAYGVTPFRAEFAGAILLA